MKTSNFTGPVTLGVITALFMVIPLSLSAQPRSVEDEAMDSMNDEQAVEKVVVGLFDAMRAGDGDKVRSLFVEGTILQSTAERNGVPMLSKLTAEEFAGAVETAEGPIWDEKIWDLNIQIRNRLASAWMDYAFYRGETFSHCGVNSFQLFKSEEGWKIIHLVDTRQRAGCEIPESIKPGVN